MDELSAGEPTPEQIARAAYSAWEQEGRPQGRDLAHWLYAEQRLKGNGERTEPGEATGRAANKRVRSTRRRTS